MAPMESVDQQLRQQKENYAHMTEAELCALAEDAYDLTEIAREALQAVIRERGFTVRLKLEPPAPPAPPDPFEDDLVIFAQRLSVEAARRTMKTLAAAGIPAFLSLEIRADDVKHAHAALERAAEKELEENDPDDEGNGKDYAILCPKCHSAAVVLKGRDSMLVDPPPTAKFQWNCDACGHQWVDEGIAQQSAGGQSWPGEEFPTRGEDSS